MGLRRQLTQYGTSRLSRRVGRSIPLLGAVIALVGLRYAIRRKGLVRGVVDSSLDAVPVVGAAKNLYEAARGDIIPDRVIR